MFLRIEITGNILFLIVLLCNSLTILEPASWFKKPGLCVFKLRLHMFDCCKFVLSVCIGHIL